jgi:predicted dehydrogenase
MDEVRWGVLGVARIFSLRVAPPLARSKLARLHAIASRDERKAEETAARLGIAKAYGSYEALLADPEVEAVYIPLPNHLHAPYIRKAAEAGKHVLCEKPLALNAGEAAECVQHAQRRGVLLMEAFMYRFHPQWHHAVELIRAGEIGEVRAVHTLFAYDMQDPANIRNSLEMGGGGLMDIGCYAVSAPRLLFGREPQRVLGLFERHAELKTDILTSAILDFAPGRSVFTVATQSFPSQRVEVLGTGGRIDVEVPFNMPADVPPGLLVTTALGTRRPQLAPADQYGLEFEAFSVALREGRPAPTPPADAVANQKVLDALLRCERSGHWEPV